MRISLLIIATMVSVVLSQAGKARSGQKSAAPSKSGGAKPPTKPTRPKPKPKPVAPKPKPKPKPKPVAPKPKPKPKPVAPKPKPKPVAPKPKPKPKPKPVAPKPKPKPKPVAPKPKPKPTPQSVKPGATTPISNGRASSTSSSASSSSDSSGLTTDDKVAIGTAIAGTGAFVAGTGGYVANTIIKDRAAAAAAQAASTLNRQMAFGYRAATNFAPGKGGIPAANNPPSFSSSTGSAVRNIDRIPSTSSTSSSLSTTSTSSGASSSASAASSSLSSVGGALAGLSLPRTAIPRGTKLSATQEAAYTKALSAVVAKGGTNAEVMAVLRAYGRG